MDNDELIAFGTQRHGPFWVGLLAEEINYDPVTLWRIAKGQCSVSRIVQERISQLPTSPAAQMSPGGFPWKTIPSTDGELEASADGCIRRVKFKGQKSRGRILSTNTDRHGYPQVVTKVAGKRRWIPVHRLVAEACLGPRPPGMQIDHIDGNKRNNAATNLEYVTGKENMRRAYRMGLVKPPIGRRFRKVKPLISALRFVLADSGNHLTDESRQMSQNAIDGWL